MELGHQPDGFAGVGQHHAHPNIDINAEGALNETTRAAYNGSTSVLTRLCHSNTGRYADAVTTLTITTLPDTSLLPN